MTVTTKFFIGERVRYKSKAFTIDQIRIQTFQGGALVLIEYRPIYSSGRRGQWRAEKYLVRVPAAVPAAVPE